MSGVSTAIHEFGHMLLMPYGIPILGTTMVILGGSLTQLAFPLLFVGYLLRKREDGRRQTPFLFADVRVDHLRFTAVTANAPGKAFRVFLRNSAF